jgi:enterobactin synthetase component F
MVFVYDRGDDAGLRFNLDTNPALYGVAELDEHRRRLARLIEQVLANPGTRLKQLDIMGDEEPQRLLVAWNDTAATLPNTSPPAYVAQWAAETANAPAVVFENATVSYLELHNRRVSQARQLLATGIQAGDIVAVALPRSEHASMALILGSMWTFALAALITLLFLWRTALEDHTSSGTTGIRGIHLLRAIA